MDDFDSWRQELLEVAVIAQDGDGTDPVIAERRFLRLVDMLQALTGREQDRVFHAVLETLTDQEDYGAYQSVISVILRFEPERRGRLIAEGITGVLDRTEEWAGDVLGQLAYCDDDAVQAFNRAAAELAPSERQRLAKFIAEQEAEDGWLSGDRQRGRLRVS
ncbi:hypothetical protein OJ998_18045 [Solirubrobacter taibaiensis]|nr:hypothetical protein [Solirubrobacter taibaiensis]